MYRVAVVTKTMTFLGASFETKDKVDNYLLEIDAKDGLKKFRIEQDGVLIETEEGRK
jgi:hypothetical protein